MSKPMRRTLSEEGEKGKVNLETPDGVECFHEQDDGEMEFEKDLNDVKIALDKISTLTDLVVRLVSKIDLEGSERGQDHWKREDDLKRRENDLKRGEDNLKRREVQMSLRESETRQRDTSDHKITEYEKQESKGNQQITTDKQQDTPSNIIRQRHNGKQAYARSSSHACREIGRRTHK